jgi:AcrR family transcriptional regulator
MSRLGRPRNPELDDAAISAAIELVVQDGYPALTMERIAVRASVSRAALYRRWPNKVELVVDAIESLVKAQGALPDTGRLRDDFVEFLRTLVRNRSADMEAYEALIAAAMGDPELGNRCRDTLLVRFSDSFRTMITRAVDRGELPADTDIELLADVVPALALYRAQTTGQRLDEQFIDRMAEQFFTRTNAAPVTNTCTMTEPGSARSPS